MTKARLIPALIAPLIATCAFSADWPQYYGPRRDSTSAEKGILRTWPAEGPKVLWTAPLGIGFGGPAVSAGKVYLLDRDDKVGDTLRVYDLANGKELWNFAYAGPGKVEFPGSRSTPTVDGDRVYTVGMVGDLYCLSTTTQKPVWHKNIWTDFGGGTAVPASPFAPPAKGGQLPIWGIAQNPLIYRNLLIVASQAPQAGVVAYDKASGDIKWKTAPLTASPTPESPLNGGTSYVTPSLVKVGGEDHLVMIAASQGFGRASSGGRVTGIDPLTGKVLWTYSNFNCWIPVAHAVDAGEGRMLLAGGYNAGSAMIQVAKKADGTYGVTELFKNPDFGAHTQPPLLYKDHFYTQYTTNERRDGLVSMSMSGEVKWKTGQSPAFTRGGAILVDGLILATDGSKKLYLIEPDPAGFKTLASADLMEAGTNWAPLALSDGKLLIRDQKKLIVVQVGQQGK
jgi:outer membrane protein assembly factor BamB